jgi:pimeloyl-ACP methyl ester carboxylesterase
MATVAFPTISKSSRLPNGTTYSYVHIEPQGKKPWILFLHGFPSASYDWRHQINFFRELGYGILCPDLLGYGGTDKPTDLEAYRLKKMSEEVVAILDAEGVDKVLAVAHDWFGSSPLPRR